MANNKQPKKEVKYEPKKYTKTELLSREAKKEQIINLSIRIFAIVALVAIVAGIIIGIIVRTDRKTTDFDYVKEDLSKYISVDIDKFKSEFKITNNVDDVTDETVRNQVLQILNTYKPSAAVGNGTRYNKAPVAPGDVAYIFYRGYTVDEDGNKLDFTGGSNLSPNANDSNISAEYLELYNKNFGMYQEYVSPLTIGSGNFIAGFELGIVDAFYSADGVWNGKIPSSFQQYDGYIQTNKTVVEEGDYIAISYVKRNNTTSVTNTNRTTVTIDLGKADEVDKTYGLEGFASKFIGAKVGEQFAEDIIGAVVNEESVEYREVKVEKIYNRTTDTDLIEVSYTTIGSETTTTIMVDLSNTNLDKTYGSGFRNFLLGQPIGTGIGNHIARIEGQETDTLYSKVVINRVYSFSGESEPLTISVKFPSNYGSKDLAGKEAKFDVYIFGVKRYYDIKNVADDAVEENFPILTDEFITNEIKVTEQTLADYEGNSITEKYLAKIKADLKATYTDSVNEIKAEKLWEVVKAAATVKKLPQIEVDYYFNLYYAQLYSDYQQYQSYYGDSYTFEMFTQAQGLSTSTTTWQQYLTKQAENTVTEKLAFYYIAKAENLLPDAETQAALCVQFREEMFEQFLQQYGYIESNDTTGETLKEFQAEFNRQYTDGVVIENVQFEYAIEKLYAYATVTE